MSKNHATANVTNAGAAGREDPDNIRLTGKGRYKGREYYAGAITKDGQRVRLLTLPDTQGNFLDFWAQCSEVEETKRYEPRERWNGRRGSGSANVLVYQTLGGIADFIAKQKRNAGTGNERVQCVECGAWGNADEACRECGGC